MARMFIAGLGVVGTETGCGVSQMGHQLTFIHAPPAKGCDACLRNALGGLGSFPCLTLEDRGWA